MKGLGLPAGSLSPTILLSFPCPFSFYFFTRKKKALENKKEIAGKDKNEAKDVGERKEIGAAEPRQSPNASMSLCLSPTFVPFQS